MEIKLFTNGKLNPIGIDLGEIRLSIEAEFKSAPQKVVFKFFNSLVDLQSDNFFYASKSDRLFTIIDGSVFKESQTVFWRAEIFCAEKNYLSESAYFELGINRDKNNATWIENPNFNKRVSEFVKEFDLDKLPKKARLYVVGLGYYQAQVNGRKTDENFFKPLLTDFDYRIGINNVDYDEDNFFNDKKSVCYDTFDILDKLIIGKNSLSILLGTGWYCNDDKLITDPCDRFGSPKLFFEIHLYKDDKLEVLKCDQTVLVRNTARTSQLFTGDRQDFTSPNENFINAVIATPPAGKLICPKCEHDAVIEEILPVSVTKYGKIIEYDFGKNHSGSIFLKVRGERGAKLTINYYEVKTKGRLNPHTSEWIAYDVTGKEPVPVDVVYQRDEYILSGQIDEIYPLFHFNCYRYVTVECEKALEIESIKSLFISTNVAEDGKFWCSDKLISDYYNAFTLTQRDNMHSGIPSDCPHREKLPYTGDGDLASEPTLYAFRSQEFYRKWLDDVIDAQGNNGWVPYTAPNIGGAGGYWWSNVITSLPLKLYSFTGDKSILKKVIKPALKYLEFCNNVHNGDYIIRKSFIRWYLGEWLNPIPTTIDADFMNTLAYYSAVDKTSKMLKILGDSNKAEELDILKEKIKTAVNDNFYDKEKKSYLDGVQGANLLPLIYGFLDDDEEAVKHGVIKKYEKSKRFDTGIILTPILLEALTEWGESELCYKIFTADEKPSIRYMLSGETTICEHWNKSWPKETDDEEREILSGSAVSHCHPMFGSVVSWMYKYVAGLNLSRLCDRKISINPRFIKQIKRAGASKITEYGKVFVEYTAEKEFEMRIKIPYGLTAEVVIDNEGAKKLKVYGKEYTANSKKDKLFSVTLGGGEYLIK